MKKFKHIKKFCTVCAALAAAAVLSLTLIGCESGVPGMTEGTGTQDYDR